MADGFLGRWSQRKLAMREGKPPLDPEPPRVLPTPTTAPSAPTPQLAQPAAAPAPTLDDVQALKPDDSFARFVAPDVAADVRHAAMKKLFADPHYNVMDGLDIYIDDYSKPSPLSAATFRQMASAKFLNLFDEETPTPLGEDAGTASAACVTLSTATPDLPDRPGASPPDPVPTLAPEHPIEDTAHDHLDLRLQPDHAAGHAGFECEPERNPDAAFQPVPPPGC